jgi:hypothetical protein
VSAITLTAIARTLVWLFPLALAARMGRVQTLVVALLFVLTNMLVIAGQLDLARLVSIPAQGGAAWLLYDRLTRLRGEHGRSQQN